MALVLNSGYFLLFLDILIRGILVMQMKYLPAFIVIYFSAVSALMGQVSKPRFVHYTPQQGLPSSQIYQILQDDKGYLWFASDHGLAKYNGYEFIKFTSSEGLQDNTVFKLVLDPEKRLWMQTFSGRFFYVENDHIFPYKYNHQIVRMIKNNIPLNFFVDSAGNITFSCSQLGEFQIDTQGKIKKLFGGNDQRHYNKLFIDEVAEDRFVTSANALLNLQKPSFLFYRSHKNRLDSLKVPTEQGGGLSIRRLKDQKLVLAIANRLYDFTGNYLKLLYEFPAPVNYITQDAEERIWVSTYAGIFLFRYENSLEMTGSFLEDEFVTCSIQDFEGGFWISTVNNGVYYLNDLRVNAFGFKDDVLKEPLCLSTDGKTVYAGFWSGGLAAFKHNQLEILFRQGSGEYITGVFPDTLTERIYLAKKQPGYLYNRLFYPLKSDGTNSLKGRFIRLKNGDLLNASINALYKVEGDSFYYYTSIYQRTNCVFEAEEGVLFLGTNSGAFRLKPDGNLSAPVHDSLKDIRVDDICRFGDIFCFATRGKGVMLMRHDSVYVVGADDGLCSNMINRVTVSDDALWCCSYNGVSKLMIRDFPSRDFEISNVSINEGLPDNEINDLIILNDTLWLASKKSISFFNVHTDFHNRTAPGLLFTNFRVNNRSIIFKDELNLNYDENSISIGFEAISYKSNGKIMYKYFLVNGPDTFVSTTTNRHVEFLSLKPGSYSFNVSAMNSNGTWTSSPLTCSFVVLAPFWQQGWFLMVSVAIAFLTIYLFLKNRITVIKEREQLKTDFNKQLLTLEMKALRAQMNPHFIFNVINSIQDYILKNDAKAAQKYLTKFARLVRLILDNSMTGEVLLSDELRASGLYMELEEQRFDGKFDFVLKLKPGIESDAVLIPSMIIQPFLENAVKHGIQHLDHKGNIVLSVDQNDTHLLIHIEDNGVGREAAARWNELNVQDHISRGSTITHKRVSAYNVAHNTDIRLNVTDLYDGSGKGIGTRVELSIPLKYAESVPDFHPDTA